MELTLNLTQHETTAEQSYAGVRSMHRVYPQCDQRQPIDRLRELLTFEDIPSRAEIECRAGEVAELADYSAYIIQSGGSEYVTRAMIGGAPFLMAPLAQALRSQGLTPIFAFSRRESEEVVQSDGAVKKVVVFRHLGFVVDV
jgi:hypothetical protein